MTALLVATHAALVGRDEVSTREAAALAGASMEAVIGRLYKLEAAGLVERGRRTRAGYLWTARPADLRARTACQRDVEEVLRRGPVVGQREVARRAGYSVRHTREALRVVGQRDGARAPYVWRLREGA